METFRCTTQQAPVAFSREYERLLHKLRRAAIEAETHEVFEFEWVAGYPFAWVLHPGLEPGAMVATYADLLFLDHLGYITIQFEERSVKGTFSLTPAGLARCAEIEVFQA